MANNPLIIPLPTEVGGFISCVAHATYQQRVTVFLDDQELGVFQGTGENVKMTLANGRSVLSLPADGSASGVSFYFEFSTDGHSFQRATVEEPIKNVYGTAIQITVTSEDGADSDDNDTYLTFTYSS